MSHLFDTDAISEVWRPRPLQAYLRWLEGIPLERQYASAVTLGELYKGAYRSSHAERYLRYIEERLLPNVTILPYDTAVARVFGSVRAALEVQGRILEDPDLHIAATAIHHGLELVTGNLAPFERVPGLKLNPILANSR
ncbi:MAG: PIN domain-containing protein [bacterium]|nr:PIN domain-containing protein [bacterium]